MSAKKKVTLYFPVSMLEETKEEALRQDRSLSWIIQTAWRLARHQLKTYPGVDDSFDDARKLEGGES